MKKLFLTLFFLLSFSLLVSCSEKVEPDDSTPKEPEVTDPTDDGGRSDNGDNNNNSGNTGGGSTGDTNISVTSISISPTSLTMYTEESDFLVVTIYPSNATNQSYTLTSLLQVSFPSNNQV